MASIKKNTEFRLICSVVGIVIGAFIGGGIISQTKKSQRSSISAIAIAGGTLVGLIGGYRLGDKLDTEAYFDELLGIKKAETEYYKNGRSWSMQTIWTDSESKQYVLETSQNYSKVLVTKLNNEVIMNHEIQSGSKVNVEKYHQNARNIAFNKLRAEIKA
jgi:hypothetical protein